MEKLLIILDWIGAFFLSIEAIKLKNFKALNEKLRKLKITLNPTYGYGENGAVYIPIPPKGYKIFRNLSVFIQILVGYLICFLVVNLFNLTALVLTYFRKVYWVILDDSVLFVILKLYLGGLLFILFPFYLGVTLTKWFSIFSDRYLNILGKLEQYTYAGIIGSIGFIILSISFIIKLCLQ